MAQLSRLKVIVGSLFGFAAAAAAGVRVAQAQNATAPTFGSAATGVPVGTVIAFTGPGPGQASWESRSGWMHCDGRSINRTNPDFSALFDAIGSSWGGDGVNAFNLPDLRGRFLRGVDAAQGRDPDVGQRTASNAGGHTGDQVGSLQPDAFASHKHPVSINPPSHDHTYQAPGGPGSSGKSGNEQGTLTQHTTDNPTLTVSMDPMGSSTETRPKNAGVYYIIRFK
jgi:microcystin-dependent protein